MLPVVFGVFFKKAIEKNYILSFNDIGGINGKYYCSVFIGTDRHTHLLEVCILQVLYKFGR